MVVSDFFSTFAINFRYCAFIKRFSRFKLSLFIINMYDTSTKIGLCSDHAGFQLKESIKQWLSEKGYQFEDFGTDSEASCDYPDYAHPCALAVESGRCGCGIAICGSGNGISMTLNKHQGIRAALCWEPELARLARAHNDANILSLPARFIPVETALEIVKAYLEADFEGGRHQRRIDKIPVK